MNRYSRFLLAAIVFLLGVIATGIWYPHIFKKRMSEEERKGLYIALVKCEDYAEEGADKEYPNGTHANPPKGVTEEQWKVYQQNWNNAQKRLLEQCKAELALKYGLSKEDLWEILLEGAEKEWPLP